MTGAYLAGFLVLAGLDTAAHVMFKLAAMHAVPLEATWTWAARVAGIFWVYGGMACYVGTFFTWMTLLRRAPLGPAFAASHFDVVTVLVASACLLGERISTLQVVGAALILAGIACLAFSESQAAHVAGSPAR